MIPDSNSSELTLGPTFSTLLKLISVFKLSDKFFLIFGIILFAFGSGPVKGFAITLGIGIITTLFTAYFLARHLTSLVVLNTKNKEIKI